MKCLLLFVILFLNMQATDEKQRVSLVVTEIVKEGYASVLQSYASPLYYDINSNLASQRADALLEKNFIAQSSHGDNLYVAYKTLHRVVGE